MASTYSSLKIELIGTGEQVGTWGATTNTNLGTTLEEAIVGSADVAFSSSDVTLTLTNSNGSQTARHVRLNLTGTSGGARNLILGSGCQIDKPYIINNGLADTVTVKNTAGTGIAVPAGKSMWVYNNGTNVVDVTTHASSLTLGAALPVASGGTGATTLTANNVILGNGTSAVQFVAPGSNGNILTSNGTTWVSSTPSAGGTVTSVSGTGTASGLTLSGTVTTSGSLTLSGTVNSLASGTYNISISGSAGSATTATKLSTTSGSAPAFGIRAWGTFNGTGSNGSNMSINDSGNVSSVFKNNTGDYTITFTTSMPTADYAITGTVTGGTGDGSQRTLQVHASTPGGTPTTKSTSQVRIIYNGQGGVLNSQFCSFMVIC